MTPTNTGTSSFLQRLPSCCLRIDSFPRYTVFNPSNQDFSFLLMLPLLLIICSVTTFCISVWRLVDIWAMNNGTDSVVFNVHFRSCLLAPLVYHGRYQWILQKKKISVDSLNHRLPCLGAILGTSTDGITGVRPQDRSQMQVTINDRSDSNSNIYNRWSCLQNTIACIRSLY